jgi:hypothetical protein
MRADTFVRLEVVTSDHGDAEDNRTCEDWVVEPTAAEMDAKTSTSTIETDAVR